MKEIIAFVDPYPSAAYLAAKLKAYSIPIIAIYSLATVGEYLHKEPELFDYAFEVDKDDPKAVAELIHQLKALHVTRIYSGSEASVSFTDLLAQALSPAFANDPDTAVYRSDKFKMQEALLQAGLPVLPQQIVRQDILSEAVINTVTSWQMPIIIKPCNSTGSHGVKRCTQLAELYAYFKQKQKAEHNLFDVPIEAYTVQPFLTGVEFLVDTFSVKGEHFICGVQKYKKELFNGNPIYLYLEMILDPAAQFKGYEAYIRKVLDAVGLKNGFAHTEIMLTEKGPYLIEVNPRVSGLHGSASRLFSLCQGYDQIDFLIQSCLDRPIHPLSHPHHGRVVCLQNYEPRTIGELNIERLKTLSSYQHSFMLQQPGSFAGIPADLLDTIAVVILSHQNEAVLEQEYATLLRWEKDKLLF